MIMELYIFAGKIPFSCLIKMDERMFPMLDFCRECYLDEIKNKKINFDNLCKYYIVNESILLEKQHAKIDYDLIEMDEKNFLPTRQKDEIL